MKKPVVIKPYKKDEVQAEIECLKDKLYDFSANLNTINMEIVRSTIVQACVDNAIDNLNTAVHALEPIEIHVGG